MLRFLLQIVICVLFLCTSVCFAELGDSGRKQVIKKKAPRTAFSGLSIFKKDFNANKIISIVDLDEVEKPKVKKTISADEQKAIAENKRKKEKGKLRYVSSNPNDDEVISPEQTPSVRVNPEAPSSIRAMISAKRAGDNSLAEAYADQFVRYQQSYFFEVQQMVSLIGEALVRQKVINEEDWDGVGQMIDYEMAKTRYEKGEVIKPTHDAAMKQIEADVNQKAEIYYFFNLNCSWCRYMAPDIERLWRLSRRDKNISMNVLTVGSGSMDWLSEYKSYNGWTMPVMNGSALAKKWNIGFVPAVVVVSPTNKKAYMKTGQQSFGRLYEFTKTVQGLPAVVTSQFKSLAEMKIGEVERSKANTNVAYKKKGTKLISLPAQDAKIEIQRF